MAGSKNFNTTGSGPTAGAAVKGLPSSKGDGYKGGKSVGNGAYSKDLNAACKAGADEHGSSDQLMDRGDRNGCGTPPSAN